MLGLIWGAPVIVTVAMWKKSYITGTCLSSLAITVSCLGQWIGNGSRSGGTDPATLVSTFIFTGTVGMAMAISLQGIVAYLAAWLLFGSEYKAYMAEFAKGENDIDGAEHIAKRFEMSRSWRYRVFLLCFAFVMAGLLEEGMKYGAIVGARRYGRVVNEHDYIAVGITSALGFAVVELIGFVYAAHKQKETLTRFVMTILERIIFGLPTHAMMTTLVAINVIRRDVRHEPMTLWQVLQEPVLYHGCTNTVLVGFSAYNGNVGWIHPRGLTMYIMLALAVGYFVFLGNVVKHRLEQYDLHG
jgi:hypothetical protein